MTVVYNNFDIDLHHVDNSLRSTFFFLLKAPSPSSAFTLKKLLHCKWEFKYDLSRMQDIAKVTAVDTLTKSRLTVVP